MAQGFLAAYETHKRDKQQALQNERTASRDTESDRRFGVEQDYRSTRDATLAANRADDREYQVGRDKIRDAQYRRSQDRLDARDKVTDAHRDQTTKFGQDQTKRGNTIQDAAIKKGDERYDQQWKHKTERERLGDDRYRAEWEAKQEEYKSIRGVREAEMDIATKRLQIAQQQAANDEERIKYGMQLQKIQQDRDFWAKDMPFLGSLLKERNAETAANIWNARAAEGQKVVDISDLGDRGGVSVTLEDGTVHEFLDEHLDALEAKWLGPNNPAAPTSSLRTTPNGGTWINPRSDAGQNRMDGFSAGILKHAGFSIGADTAIGEMPEMPANPYVQAAAEKMSAMMGETLLKYHNQDKLGNRWPSYYERRLGNSMKEVASSFTPERIEALKKKLESESMVFDPEDQKKYIAQEIQGEIYNQMAMTGRAVLMKSLNMPVTRPTGDKDKAITFEKDGDGKFVGDVDFMTSITEAKDKQLKGRELNKSNADSICIGLQKVLDSEGIAKVKELIENDSRITGEHDEVKYLVEEWLVERQGEEANKYSNKDSNAGRHLRHDFDAWTETEDQPPSPWLPWDDGAIIDFGAHPGAEVLRNWDQ